MDEIDIAKIQNFVDSKIIAPMNVQEQKALCRAVLSIEQEIDDIFLVIDYIREHDPEVNNAIEKWMQILKNEEDAH